MAVIALEGMSFHAFHGYYEEEQKMGGAFILDVYLTTPSVARAAASDDLDGTINYETIYFICNAEMKKTSKMIEAVAQRILDRLSYQYEERTEHIKVRLRKCNPPLGGKVACAYIELESSSSGGSQGGGGRSFNDMDDDDDDMEFDNFGSMFR
ncbi:MAG: dihydroneopterin aldolase [Bacteroidota bacterium]